MSTYDGGGGGDGLICSISKDERANQLREVSNVNIYFIVNRVFIERQFIQEFIASMDS